jgi:putative ABC transport system permease protein
MMMLSRDLIRWVALANLVAWPVAFFIMNRWLENFPTRIGFSWLFFVLAGLLTLFIAWFSTSFQAYKAANTDPVSALKHE